MAVGEDHTMVLRLVHEIVRISGLGFSGSFKKDCTDLARRVSLLAHLFEEIKDSEKTQENCDVGPSSLSSSCFAELTFALQAAKRLVFAANNSESSKFCSDGATNKIIFQFQCVTWKLEKALSNLPYGDFDISEEVQEQIDLVRAQLRRATERYSGPMNSVFLQRAISQPLEKDIDPFQPRDTFMGSLHVESVGSIDHEVSTKLEVPIENALDEVCNEENLRNSATSSEVCVLKDSDCKSTMENKNKSDSLVIIPDDFRCPISLELMRDPVIVATGQTYERSYIQRWIDCGNTTCPKTQLKLQHLTLTPNYVLRSLISQWCLKHDVKQPTTSLKHGRLKKSDGSFHDVTDDITAIEALIRKLSSSSVESCRSALSEIRSLSKRSTDNRILLAEAGAIPILVNLLTSDDVRIQDNAVTCILNISIYKNNKGLIMLANAVPSIVQVLRAGSPEAKENAAATLFSLSLADENKIIIGASGAITALVDLLENGGPRGKKDAATALFNLCIYHVNKGRAVRAGIIDGLLRMLTDTGGFMVDEALTILSVLVGHQEAKSAIVKVNMMPVLVGILRTGLPRGKENAASILLSLCKRDNANLDWLSRLGGVVSLTEIAENGTERAKRKATSLLEQLRKSQQV
ncbi:U-box domain-containing protein 11 [Castilleja foliolosa]|uniref:RING-type E3 ubiquitin transferase n=1 Tax=Castilleja foliolosa TaxID=1961234 RepID=A0ABD3CPI3_9LAMI